MSAMDYNALRRRMGEAAVLPPDDPDRRAVETEVAKAGVWAEAEWLELLRETEQFRYALRRVEPPTDLIDKLSRIPDELLPRHSTTLPTGPLTTAGIVGGLIAASVVMATLFITPTTPPAPIEPTPHPVVDVAAIRQELAANVVRNHAMNHYVAFQTADCTRLESELRRRMSCKKTTFAVKVPDLQGFYELRGGRPCQLNHTPVVCFVWRPPANSCGQSNGDPATDNGHSCGPANTTDCICSMYQFRLGDFDLPPNLPAESIEIARPDGSAARVLIWTESDYGYALITDRVEDVAPLTALLEARR